MRVSFDLDEVLFVDPRRYEIEEPPRSFAGIFFRERLRKGTVMLINELQRRGFEVWVYTSSFRSEKYIKTLFGLYGVRFDGIVNAQRHNKEVQANRKQRLPQKMPTHYQISLHIDDEDNIIKNSHSFGYRAYRVYEPDENWVQKVLAEAERIRGIEKLQHAHAQKQQQE
jgi:hypothetical protein